MAKNINEIHNSKLSWQDKLALKITNFVGSMWCAYIFATLALISLPAAINGGVPTLISWVAQTFLQLVLLSIIMNGQRLDQKHSELRAENDYHVDLKNEAEIEALQKKLDLIMVSLNVPYENTTSNQELPKTAGDI